jgi:uncharacterized membrane protein
MNQVAQTQSVLDEEPKIWVIAPTRALSWAQAKRVLWLITLIPAGSGLLFLYFGAPLVMPFAGLEIALLWLAFYYVIRAGRLREVVRITDTYVMVEKGFDTPSEVYLFERAWVRIAIHRSPRPWYPSRLSLTSHGREVTLGDFLTEGERIKLAQSLFNAIHKTR